MSRIRFLEQLASDGRVTVAPPDAETATPDQIEALLAAQDRLARAEMPRGAPPLDLAAARYGLELLYSACQLLVYRDLGAELLRSVEIAPPASPGSVGSQHLAVDLTLRFLPDVLRLARAASPDDPLVQHLCVLGRAWPLSSVGIRNLGEVDPVPLKTDPVVWQIYVERVVGRRDHTRAQHPLVQTTLREWVGEHSDLLAGMLPL